MRSSCEGAVVGAGLAVGTWWRSKEAAGLLLPLRAKSRHLAFLGEEVGWMWTGRLCRRGTAVVGVGVRRLLLVVGIGFRSLVAGGGSGSETVPEVEECRRCRCAWEAARMLKGRGAGREGLRRAFGGCRLFCGLEQRPGTEVSMFYENSCYRGAQYVPLGFLCLSDPALYGSQYRDRLKLTCIVGRRGKGK